MEEVFGYHHAKWSDKSNALVGIDGGSKFGVASWATALDCDTVGDALEGEDVVATAAEIIAIYQLLEAAADVIPRLLAEYRDHLAAKKKEKDAAGDAAAAEGAASASASAKKKKKKPLKAD